MWNFIRRLMGARDVEIPATQEVSMPFVRRIDGLDGGHRLFVRRRGDLFTWEVETLTEPDEYDREWGADAYWRSTDTGGLFAAADEAEADARKSLAWLRQEDEAQDDE